MRDCIFCLLIVAGWLLLAIHQIIFGDIHAGLACVGAAIGWLRVLDLELVIDKKSRDAAIGKIHET